MKLDGLFNFKIKPVTPSEGKLLVASPSMDNSDLFSHTVITIINHSYDEGAMGLIMNNRLEGVSLQDALPDKINIDKPIPIFLGGPVDTEHLFFMHTLGSLFNDTDEVSPGLYVSGDFDTMIKYVNSGYEIDGHIRFFVGYSGWSKGQLENECANGYWAVAAPIEPASDALTGADDAYWHKIVREMGPEYRMWLQHPKNPALN